MKNFTKMMSWALALALSGSLAFAQTSNVADVDPNAPAAVSGVENVTVTSINESFEGTTFPPSGWTLQSPDMGTGWNRQLAGTTPVPGWTGTGSVVTPVGGGSAVAFCTWNTGGATYNDQWLITPQLTGVASTDVLTFWIYKFSVYNDSLQVLVSTTGNATANFNNVLADLFFGANDTGWTQLSYPLAAFAGQDIYIAFREHVADNFNDGGAFFLDLVQAGAGGGTGSQMFDLQLVLNADSISQGGAGLAGSEFDGTNFFAAEWGFNGGKTIFRINPAGALVDSIIPTWITAASGVRDLAWDGTYLYGSPANTTIYCFTPSGSLVSTITSPVAVRAIAYDPVNDAFWVNNFSTDLTLVSRTGAILNVIATPPSCYGMAYDGNTTGGPYLWLFTGTSTGLGCQVDQFKISTGMATGVTHSISGDLGASCIAGGLWTAPNVVPGEYSLGGLAQGEQDIFAYYLDMAVGEQEINVSELEVSIFPNPATEQFRVNSIEPIVSLEVMNNIGQTVYTAAVNNTEATIDVRNFSKGVYFVRIQGEKSAVTRKVSVE